MESHPLSGKTALITGVSRRAGIGFAIARRLIDAGASVFVQHHAAHDGEQPWGADDLDAVRAELRGGLRPGARFGDAHAELADPAAPAALVSAAAELTGGLDILVCNHANSGGDGSIFDMTPERLDAHWQVNTRSTLLLTRHFAERYAPLGDGAGPARPGERAETGGPLDEHRTGRVVWLTSGQQDGPMRGEVAYATGKAALAGITATVAAELLERGVILNTVNPGPVNTGYLDPETTDRDLTEVTELIARTPFGRFGAPDDPARLIAWLVSDDGRWIVGQVLKSDGGFDLWR
ncbi:3-oxoacyl-[acyl-carrier protein] reductase [Stackebrandtia albiflava]|uniref:3-oxoacyl-[acyl-carrier protein] reductase n=1 Tax=Stackebrandtia albiflava TaxID=406432 RepID=A0A562VAA9_9ACTN|nr:SDR family oxidoreductase [Stackebrandtia albiflava]TWJ14781.1 3-oxoacyl-[acyl-carrier protein] reductase [Stackebrandtia albiflava]